MKKYIVFICLSFLCLRANSATTPSVSSVVVTATTLTDPTNPYQYFSTLSMKEVQKLAGRKLKLKEKIAVKFLQWKVRKGYNPARADGNKDKGKTALIFGIIGLVCLFLPIPYIGGLAAIVGTVLALVLGYQAKKENPNDKKAKTAIILGWISVGLVVIALAVLAFLVVSWGGFGWG